MSSPQNTHSGPPIYRTNPPNTLSESPIYRSKDHTLHWIDMLSSPCLLHILPLTPTGSPLGPARVIPTSVPVTCIRFTDTPGKYICATKTGIGILDEGTGGVEVLSVLIGDGYEVGGWNMNDGGVDARGRFWVGEVDLDELKRGHGDDGVAERKGRGRLWRFQRQGEGWRCDRMDGDFVCGNGIGWSPDGKFMYFNDSGIQTLWRYDFDAEKGEISNKMKLIDGLPGKSKEVFNDGLVVDQEGDLWISMWMDYAVEVYSPDGKLLKRIEFPAKCPTCPTWGGEDHDILYVASSPPFHEKAPDDEGGHVFSYHAGVKGQVNHEFEL